MVLPGPGSGYQPVPGAREAYDAGVYCGVYRDRNAPKPDNKRKPEKQSKRPSR